MAVTVADLVSQVNAGQEHEAQLADNLAQATVLVDQWVGDAVVPESILDLCYTRVAIALFEQDNYSAPSSGDYEAIGQVIAPPNRDPLSGIYNITRRYVLPW